MRTKVAIIEKSLIDDKWFFVNQVFSFVEVTGEREKVYKIKADNRFYHIPGSVCTEIPDNLILDSRNGFQIMEDTMDDTKNYQKAYIDILGIHKPKMYSAETGKLLTDNEPIETDGRQKDIPRASDPD